MRLTSTVWRSGLGAAGDDPFDLDIRISEIVTGLEDGMPGGTDDCDHNPTDDNCSSTCPTACVSEAGPAEDC